MAEYERALVGSHSELDGRSFVADELRALAAFDIANSLRIWQFGFKPRLEAVCDAVEEDQRPRRRVERMEECLTVVMKSECALDEDPRPSIVAELYALSMADISNTLRVRLFGTQKKSEE